MPDRDRTANLLGATATALGTAVLDEAARAAGGTAARAAALATLAQWPGGTIESLRRVLGLSHSATVRTINGLVADGLAERRALGGGPAVQPVLTGAGHERAAAVLAARDARLRDALAELDDGDARALEGALERLLAALTGTPEHGDWICRLCSARQCPQERCPVEQRARAGAP